MGGSMDQYRNITAAMIQQNMAKAAEGAVVKVVEIPECRSCKHNLGTIEILIKQRDAAQGQVDEIAARVVALQRRVDEVGPGGVSAMTMAQERIVALQKLDNTMRHNLERAEARASQLIEVFRAKNMTIPDEPKYYVDKDAIEALVVQEPTC